MPERFSPDVGIPRQMGLTCKNPDVDRSRWESARQLTPEITSCYIAPQAVGWLQQPDLRHQIAPHSQAALGYRNPTGAITR